MTKILSFDIGMRHLAYAFLECHNSSIKVIEWDVVDLYEVACGNDAVDTLAEYLSVAKIKRKDYPEMKGSLTEIKAIITSRLKATLDSFKLDAKESLTNIDLISCKLRSFLELHPSFLQADYVCLENQPVLKNPVMKSVQMVLYAWFIFATPPSKYIQSFAESTTFKVKLVAASNKNKVLPFPKKTLTYKERKRLGIEQTLTLLREYFAVDDTLLVFFDKHLKKDDLADSFLQAIFVAQRYAKFELKKSASNASSGESLDTVLDSITYNG